MVQYGPDVSGVPYLGVRLSQRKHLPSLWAALFWLAMLAPFGGCQSQTNPWVGKPYHEPTGYSNPPQSIYAPMPSILPSIDGTAMETDESLEAELDLLIDRD
jgi:hypothetical protein